MTALEKVERPVPTGPFQEGGANSPLEGAVVDALRTVFDPEIPISIYDLGLIYVN